MVQWLRLCAPIAGSLEPIPGQGTRFLMLQLKMPCAPAKTQWSQINNKYLKNKPPPSKKNKSSSLSLTVSPPCLHYTRWENVETVTGVILLGSNSLEKTLTLGKIEDRRRRGYKVWAGWTASLIQWTWVSAKTPGVLQAMVSQRIGPT